MTTDSDSNGRENYQVALSFAGEQRDYVEEVARICRAAPSLCSTTASKRSIFGAGAPWRHSMKHSPKRAPTS